MGFCGGLGARTGGVWRRVVCVHPRDDFSSVVPALAVRLSILYLSIYLSHVVATAPCRYDLRSSNTLLSFIERDVPFFLRMWFLWKPSGA